MLEKNNCNYIHVMTILACLRLEAEEYLREVYSLLVNLLPKETMKRLLLQESDTQMRPVEMAANNGTLGLFQDLFETNGVHMTSTYISGVYTKSFTISLNMNQLTEKDINIIY